MNENVNAKANERDEAYYMENEVCCSPEFPQGCIAIADDEATS